MGADKAFLELAGKPLIARAVDLAREIERFGADTVGGLGISVPPPA